MCVREGQKMEINQISTTTATAIVITSTTTQLGSGNVRLIIDMLLLRRFECSAASNIS